MKRNLHKRNLTIRSGTLITLRIWDYNGFFKLAEALLQIHTYASYHTLWNNCLTIISSHPLSASLAKDVWIQQSQTEIINYRNFKWTFEDSLPCHCYETKSNRKKCAQ